MDTTQTQTPRTDNFKSQGREWLPLGIFEKVERENTILREALEKFRGQFDCYECSGTAEDTLDSLANDKDLARRALDSK